MEPLDPKYVWIQEMGRKMWKTLPSGRGMQCVVPDARLTREELEELLRIILLEPLICQMESGTFGLGGYAMKMWYHPDVPGMPPSYALSICDENLPEEFGHRHVGTPGQRKEVLNRVWDLFSTYTHSDKNIEWLKMYGLALPKSKESYEY